MLESLNNLEHVGHKLLEWRLCKHSTRIKQQLRIKPGIQQSKGCVFYTTSVTVQIKLELYNIHKRQVCHINKSIILRYLWFSNLQDNATYILCAPESTLCYVMLVQCGVYIFQIMDWYSASFSLMTISFMEVLVISWIYGQYSLQSHSAAKSTSFSPHFS